MTGLLFAHLIAQQLVFWIKKEWMNFTVVLIFLVNLLGIFILPQYIYFNSTKSFAVKSILPFLVLTAISSLFELIFIYFLKFDSYVWSKLYFIIEFLVFAAVFNRLLNKKFLVITFFFTFLFFSTYFYFFYVSENYPVLKVFGILYFIQFLFIILFVVLWFKEIFEKKEVQSLLDLPLFYFVSGLLIYFSGTIFLFILSDEILNAGLSLYYYWIVNLVLVLIFRIFLLLTIWKDRLI